MLGQGKSFARLNGGESNLTLNHFSVGTMVQMPDLLADEIQVVDADVARYPYHTEHYYPAAIQRIEQAIDALDQAVRQPKYAVISRRHNAPREPVTTTPKPPLHPISHVERRS